MDYINPGDMKVRYIINVSTLGGQDQNILMY